MTEDNLVLLTTGFCLGGVCAILALLAMAQIAAWIAPYVPRGGEGECPVIPIDKMRQRRNLRRWWGW